MSPETNSADSAGVPWEGRRFEPNPAVGDDGSADPALYAALTNFRNGSGDQIAIVEALRTARVLIPLIAEKGEEGVAPSGLAVDKTQELSIVTVAAPDGRTVLPIFTSVDAMRTWDPLARPIPVAGVRAALSAASDQTDLIVIDPTAETEYIVRRPAVWALAQDVPWVPSAESPEVFAALQESVATELAVIDLTMASGDPQARLHGPELVVSLELVDGLDQTQLDAVLQRLAQRWAADNRVAVLVDSLSVKLVRSAS